MHGLERMVLAGLEVDEVAELMSRIAGHDIGAGGQRLAAEITAETDGNPFFVGQILRHLRESGAVEQDQDGRWHVLTSIADLGLPQSVHEVIARRVERLGGEAEAILTVAAVIGRSFDVKLLERLVGRGEDQLLAALEAATAGAVLIESSEAMGRFVFAHALIRHSLYETLSALRRARCTARWPRRSSSCRRAIRARTWPSSRITGGWPAIRRTPARRCTTRGSRESARSSSLLPTTRSAGSRRRSTAGPATTRSDAMC